MQRAELKWLTKRMESPRNFIQVISGPRQIGKTTLIRQYCEQTSEPYLLVSADAIGSIGHIWISQQWDLARLKIKSEGALSVVLIIDEIQKIDNWSEIVKKEWDADTSNRVNIKLILLGSSRMLLQQGLTESLAGRFEVIYLGHWSFFEMNEAFDMNYKDYILFGGYPGAAELIPDENRWKTYIRESLIESSISRDILMLTRVDKPALMQNLFEIGSSYSGQILSFNKILGQLQDAGNTTTLSHYLRLLDSAGLLGGIEKYSSETVRKRASSPKFQVYNNAILSALSSVNLETLPNQAPVWGRWVESAVGAHLINVQAKTSMKVFYWRNGNDEVDFVMHYQGKIIGLEVKSNHKRQLSGLMAFQKSHHVDKVLLIGEGGLPVESFLKINPLDLF